MVETSYSNPVFYGGDCGNNSFSYAQRKAAWSQCILLIPAIKKIDSLSIDLWHDIVCEEYDDSIVSCTWLAHMYERWKIKIFDNHNYALYRWLQNPMHVIHIDQHSDMWLRSWAIDMSRLDDQRYIYDLTNFDVHIGNFVSAYLTIQTCTQLRTQSCVLDHKPVGRYILDIDCDFWAPEMLNTHRPQTINKVRDMMRYAEMVTIATSPYFIDQQQAIDIIHQLCA